MDNSPQSSTLNKKQAYKILNVPMDASSQRTENAFHEKQDRYSGLVNADYNLDDFRRKHKAVMEAINKINDFSEFYGVLEKSSSKSSEKSSDINDLAYSITRDDKNLRNIKINNAVFGVTTFLALSSLLRFAYSIVNPDHQFSFEQGYDVNVLPKIIMGTFVGMLSVHLIACYNIGLLRKKADEDILKIDSPKPDSLRKVRLSAKIAVRKAKRKASDIMETARNNAGYNSK